MKAWIYSGRRWRDEADRLAEELRESGEFSAVLRANVRYYDGTVHKGCVVYHDGARRDLTMAHEDAGVELRRIDRQNPVPRDTPSLRVEETSPGWWKVLDADDSQVGKAHRSEDRARAAMEDM